MSYPLLAVITVWDDTGILISKPVAKLEARLLRCVILNESAFSHWLDFLTPDKCEKS